MHHVRRHQLDDLVSGLDDGPVTVVAGARQVGKSTLCAEVVATRAGVLRTLDDPTVLAAARRDPVAFLEHDSPLLVIDEIQRAPELVVPLKLLVDRDRRPGRYLVTGSSDLLRVPGAADSLAGRTVTLRLRGFSQGEIEDRRERFIDRCFAGDRFTDLRVDVDRTEYARRICTGGYPPVVESSPRARQRFFTDYASRAVVRSVGEIASLAEPERLPRLLRLLAAASSSELNRADLGRNLGVAPNTVDRMVSLLQTLHLVEVIPAWSRNLTQRQVRRPKVFVNDPGLLADLLGIGPEVFDPAIVSRAVGPLVETFVVTELLKQREWSATRPDLFHFRDHDGAEVDVLLESRSGSVVLIEVKATRSVGAQQTRWIDRLAARLGPAFVHGYVMYTGDHVVPFGPHVTAVPIAALWSA